MQNVVPGVLQRLRAVDVIRMAGLMAAASGQEYCRSRVVHNTQRRGTSLTGIVDVPHRDTSAAEVPAAGMRQYSVEVEIQSISAWIGNCDCGQSTPLCSHAAALLYQWLEHPALFVVPAASQQESAALGHEKVETMEQSSKPTHLPLSAASLALLRGPIPVSNLLDILSQLGLSEIRSIAREYDITTNGMNKLQLAEAIKQALERPEEVRRVAATLEKPQRQLLAALTLANGAMTDDDLRGLFERFSLGQPSQLQNILVALQGKALLFRTSLNSSSVQRVGLGSALLDIGWYVPIEVRMALRVMVPVTPFQVEGGDDAGVALVIKEGQAYNLLADLLLVARALDGYRLTAADQWLEQHPAARLAEAATFARSNHPLSADGSMPIPAPHDVPAEALLAAVSSRVARPPAFLRFAIQLLHQAAILHKDDNGDPYLRVLPNAAQLLMGPARRDAMRDFFELWVAQSSYTELFDLSEDGLRLRCRATSLGIPVLRIGELDAENSEARQTLIALLAQTPPNRWINFTAFARFVYRLNPTFLQRRQRLSVTPHWWLEVEEGHPLRPLQLNDWLRAELYYLARFLSGPMYWWGACDIALSSTGRLLAFRLTSQASWLLNRVELVEEPEPQNYHLLFSSLEIVDEDTLLVPCAPFAWTLIEIMEMFTESVGIRGEYLCYRFTPRALGEALSRGYRPTVLLEVLQQVVAQRQAEGAESALTRLVAQLERWVASYGHVRLYTGVTLLETADTIAMRELSATTALDTQIVRTVHPTLHILKKAGSERMLEDLKRRGLSPLIHDEELYGTE